MPCKDPIAYRKANRDHINQGKREAYQRNKAKILASQKKKYWDNREAFKAKNKASYYKDHPKRKAYERERYWNNPERKAATNNAWKKPSARKRIREFQAAKRRSKDPKFAARVKLRKAVYRGLIHKPNFCNRCGVIKEKRYIHGHHEDYSKPFDVEWVCSTCHGEITRLENPG